MEKDKDLIGIDLGGTTTKMAFLSPDGKVTEKWNIPTNIDDNGTHIVPDLIQSINEHIKKSGKSKDQFAGIGMGTPGHVDIENGTVGQAFNLNWKNDQNVREQIQQGVGLPFQLDNDANVASLGEYWSGAGNREDDVVFVTLGTGVGGGVIANGRLLHGVNGGAGEIGHITVEQNGYLCTCGKRGCLETYASATGIVHLAKDMSKDFKGKSKLKTAIDEGKEITSKDVFDLTKDKDPLASKVVDKVTSYLGLALSNIGNTLNPDSIIIGGGVSNAGNTLLKPTTKYFKSNAFPAVRNSTKVKLAELGNDAGVIGAASLALKFNN